MVVLTKLLNTSLGAYTLVLLSLFSVLAERDILALKVKCDNNEQGCQWTGELRSLEAHITDRCDYTPVQCPNNCRVQIIRKQLKQHLEHQCPKRQYSCPNCGEKGLHDEITIEHLQQCPNAMIKCPNQGCSYVAWRSNFKLHECLYEQVPCKYSDIGCKERQIRKNMEAHEKDSFHHLRLTTEMVTQLKQEVVVLKEENETIAAEAKEAITDCEETIDTLYQHILVNKEQLQRTIGELAELKQENAEMKQKITSLQKSSTDQYKAKFRLSSYSAYKETNTEFNSDPFYSSSYGYKYRIQVYTDGGRQPKGTHLSVYASLLKGDNDSSLTWPFAGTFVIELVNQLEDKNHYVQHIKFPAGNQVSKRVVDEEKASSGYGCPEFIAHSKLSFQSDKYTQYLKNDMLIFRVSVQVPDFKPWLE